MKKLKGNNKGFSLVELIVVILIMAILAVALAPQVMKWVNNSRRSADVSTYESMVSSVQLALADDSVYTAVRTGAAQITITMTYQATPATATVTISPAIATGNASAALDTELQSILGANYKTQTRPKVTTATGASSYTILVSATGEVSKGVIPTDTME
jgi:prepilin-type N-terminal cleavage/methylation domain-containing protein